jgi:uncharacterized membrane protein
MDAGLGLAINGMFDVPDPFHAAVVHFPIVFVFIGAVLALLTIFSKRGSLPQFTVLFLVLAAGSAQFAVMTGQEQKKEIIQRKPAAKTMIEHHEEWGERVPIVSSAAAFSALLALMFFRTHGLRRGLAFVTTLVAFGACYCVIEAGERGGEMVYQHGVGVQVEVSTPAATPTPDATPKPRATPTPQATPTPA